MKTVVTSNTPLCLIAVDPSISNVGVAVVVVEGFGSFRVMDTVTIHTKSQAEMPDRIGQIAQRVASLVDHYSCDYGVIEQPSIPWTKGTKRNQHPTSIMLKGAGYGAAMSGLVRRLPVSNVRDVAVAQWYPRDRGRMMSKRNLITRVRTAYPEHASSEHTCMAISLADWWSRNVAPWIWHETEKTA